MAFRSDLEAAHARAQALEGKVVALEAENAALRGVDEATLLDPNIELRRFRRSLLVALAVAVSVGAGGAAIVYHFSRPMEAVILGVLTVSLAISLVIIRELVQICPPGFVLVLSGRSRVRGDGTWIGYRIVNGGRSIRVPILERAQLLDCRLRRIDCQVVNAYCKGGTPLRVSVKASYQFGSHEPIVHRAIERFLGSSLTEADRVARETLEGFMRAFIANRSKDEVADKEHAASEIINDAEEDMRKVGMEIESLHIEEVAGPS